MPKSQPKKGEGATEKDIQTYQKNALKTLELNTMTIRRTSIGCGVDGVG